jgi:hypothetical protein
MHCQLLLAHTQKRFVRRALRDSPIKRTFIVWYTVNAALKEPMELATSFAPWENATAHALSTCGQQGKCIGA